jgi:hypothetical protein
MSTHSVVFKAWHGEFSGKLVDISLECLQFLDGLCITVQEIFEVFHLRTCKEIYFQEIYKLVIKTFSILPHLVLTSDAILTARSNISTTI